MDHEQNDQIHQKQNSTDSTTKSFDSEEYLQDSQQHFPVDGPVVDEDKDRMITLELIINNQSTYKFQYCPEWTCSQQEYHRYKMYLDTLDGSESVARNKEVWTSR